MLSLEQERGSIAFHWASVSSSAKMKGFSLLAALVEALPSRAGYQHCLLMDAQARGTLLQDGLPYGHGQKTTGWQLQPSGSLWALQVYAGHK